MSLTLDSNLTQRESALILANHTRSVIGEWKADNYKLPPAEGAERLASLLRSDLDGTLGAMRADHALKSVWRLGDYYTSQILLRASVYRSDRRLRDLTTRQRHKLAELVLERCA